MRFLRLEVLVQRATRHDVEHLEPSTDREQREVEVERSARQRELGLVTFGEGRLGARIARFAVARRVDINAARRQQPVIGREVEVATILACVHRHRLAAGALDRAGVRLPLVDAALATERDEDAWPRRGFGGHQTLRATSSAYETSTTRTSLCAVSVPPCPAR